LGGNISLAQAYVSDITTKERRAEGMGALHAAFGIAFVCGPAIGGTLALWGGYWVPSYLAALLSLINLFCVILFLRESLPAAQRTPSTSFGSTFSGLTKCFKDPVLTRLLVMRFFYGIVFTMWETSFGFYNKGRLHLDARTSSYLLTLFGIVYSIVQGRIRSFVTRMSNEERLLQLSFISLAPIYFLSGITTTIFHHILVLVPLGIASGVSQTLITTRVSKEVERTELGSALGISAALGSLTRIVAPTTGGLLLDYVGLSAPAIACGIICGFLATVMRPKLKV